MRKITTTFLFLSLCTCTITNALANPDRDSLLEAWEAHIASLPATAKLDALGNGLYEFRDTDLPFEGNLRVDGALVRSSDWSGYENEFTHLGMVDFQLVDMPTDRMSSQVYYYWVADRQTMHYSDLEQRWVSPATYQASISEIYGDTPDFAPLSFMLNYGIWVVLLALLVFVFIAVGKQAKKARSLMDDTASINDKARENIDRAEALQDEVLSIARETRDLQSENNELLRNLLDVLRR